MGISTAGCEQQPRQLIQPFTWRAGITDLDHALLSSCGSADRLFAVGGRGDSGLLLRWGGYRWRIPRVPPAGLLWWCWADDVAIVAVGEDGTVIRNRGENWIRDQVPEELSNATFFGVWGESEAQLIAVGGDPMRLDQPPVIAHYVAGEWTRADTEALGDGTLFKVWGATADDVWAVGGNGLIAHFDGNGWRRVDGPTEAPLIAVYGSARDDVFAVGGLGSGEILRFDGSRWSLFASAPEELSAVWTGPGQPLYVGGDRGYLARFDRRRGSVLAAARTTALAAENVCFHGMFGRADVVVAVGADLVAGNTEHWGGALYSHGISLAGRVPDQPTIDAGVPIDSGGPDAMTAGPGEVCSPNGCDPGLTCWWLQISDIEICTRGCSTADECAADYGEGACCERPGLQVLDRVCLPADSQECASPL